MMTTADQKIEDLTILATKLIKFIAKDATQGSREESIIRGAADTLYKHGIQLDTKPPQSYEELNKIAPLRALPPEIRGVADADNFAPISGAHPVERFVPEILASLRQTGQDVSLVQDIERALTEGKDVAVVLDPGAEKPWPAITSFGTVDGNTGALVFRFAKPVTMRQGKEIFNHLMAAPAPKIHPLKHSTSPAMAQQILEMNTIALAHLRETIVYTLGLGPGAGMTSAIERLQQAVARHLGDTGPGHGDGCDGEGFAGGCARTGHTPQTCPNAPDPKYKHTWPERMVDAMKSLSDTAAEPTAPETITMKEVWDAVGGNPDITPEREGLMNMLAMVGNAYEQMNAPTPPAPEITSEQVAVFMAAFRRCPDEFGAVEAGLRAVLELRS